VNLNVFLGVDIGSVSSNFVLMNDQCEIIKKVYLRTMGNPVQAIRSGFTQVMDEDSELEIRGVGTTGSGRYLGGTLLGADVVKNEITAHAVAASYAYPEVRTIIEIGGQDSKIILIRNGIVHDFAMNTVCAAGTGSFLDQQASRLNIAIENFGAQAAMSSQSVRIAGRCGVFAESDMIHKQQMGHQLPEIIDGLCEALVRNYLNNVGKGKEILAPVVFQGGVAANKGIRRAFEKALGLEVTVPKYHNVMGAIGAALIAKSAVRKKAGTSFYGFDMTDFDYATRSFECSGCSNMCEIVEININGQTGARWGGRCGRWNQSSERLTS
jgi:predicted CoA-substrate-specific enzyme activase